MQKNADEHRKSAIRSAVADARRALGAGIEQALGSVGIFSDGTRVPLDQLPDRWKAARLRPSADAALDRWLAQDYTPPEAVAHFVREASYTWLNRLAAIRALAARGQIVTLAALDDTGTRSQAYATLVTVAAAIATDREAAEAAVWRSIFEELAERLGALFDPLDPHGAIFPGSAALGAAITSLSKLTAEQWRADDTLGWFYQFFTTKTERQALRKKKGPAFTADDLGPINQFFTPRWIVRFLVDNALGGLWRRMHPQSQVADYCTMLVPPTDDDTPLLPKRVRELRIIDPACGTMHFGLYCFDVLVRLYREEGIEKPAVIPTLILEHNLVGVDIDRRAIQIAALGLYLKAAAYYEEVGQAIPSGMRFGLACADVAPPEPKRIAALRERISDPLVRRGFDVALHSLKSLHAIGSLIDVESDIRSELNRVVAGAQPGPSLFPSLLGQIEVDEARPQQVLDAVVERACAFAREAYVNDDPAGTLVATDLALAARVLEIVGRRYDVVLMNPPYGETMPPECKNYLALRYPASKSNLYGAFFELAFRLAEGGAVGALTDKAFLYLDSFRHLRTLFLHSGRMSVLVDGGDKILDESNVDVAATVAIAEPATEHSVATVIRLLREPDRERALGDAISRLRSVPDDPAKYVYRTTLAALAKLPTETLAYWAPPAVLNAYATLPPLEPAYGVVRVGLQTGDDERFLRYWWEVPDATIGQGKRWVPFAKGGDTSPYYESLLRVVDWSDDGTAIVASAGAFLRNRPYYFRAGLTYPNTCAQFHARLLETGAIFSHKGPGIFDCDNSLLGFLNTKVAQVLLAAQSPTRQFEVGQLSRLPVPLLERDLREKLADIAAIAVQAGESFAGGDEVDRRFRDAWLAVCDARSFTTAAQDAAKMRHDFLQAIRLSRDQSTELVSEKMGFTDADWRQVAETFGDEIGEEKGMRGREFRSEPTLDPLLHADEHARRYFSSLMLLALASRPIVARERCLDSVEQAFLKRFPGSGNPDEAARLLGMSVRAWLDREFHFYHYQLRRKRPRIVRLAGPRNRVVLFVDPLEATTNAIRSALAETLGPLAQRARADLAESSFSKRDEAEETLEDTTRITSHFESVLSRWDESPDDIRPRIALLRPLCPYVER
jgi:hypothetical protein